MSTKSNARTSKDKHRLNGLPQLITDDDMDFIREYISNAAPTGHEESGQKIWRDFIQPHVDDIFVNNYGCIAGIINPDAEFKVVIDAHADEIAWYVHRIGDDGFIHVEQTGGTDPGIAPSQQVIIHAEKGPVTAVFGWPAIHVRETSDDKPKREKIFVDCGCKTKEEVEALGRTISLIGSKQRPGK